MFSLSNTTEIKLTEKGEMRKNKNKIDFNSLYIRIEIKVNKTGNLQQ